VSAGTQTPVRLGIIGANPTRGWASMTHLPAVHALPEVELVAVATTNQESANAARAQYGARYAFSDPLELIALADIEAVTVAVKVPDHKRLVTAALEAGKHVYCEWPLGVDTDEALAMHALARRAGARTIIGLQTGRSPAARRVRAMVADGAIGRLLSATHSDTSAYGGAHVSADRVWSLDRANGASILTISVAHGLDLLEAVGGTIEALNAEVRTSFAEATVTETGERVPVTVPDQVAIVGMLAGGAVLTTHVRGGVPYDNGFSLQLHGTEGSLELSAAPSLYSAPLTVEHVSADGVRSDVTDSTGRLSGLSGPRAYVAQLYRDFAAAIRSGEVAGPDFALAVRRHELLDAISAASVDGTRHTA
jgi:predicted dehydrogenase